MILLCVSAQKSNKDKIDIMLHEWWLVIQIFFWVLFAAQKVNILIFWYNKLSMENFVKFLVSNMKKYIGVLKFNMPLIKGYRKIFLGRY